MSDAPLAIPQINDNRLLAEPMVVAALATSGGGCLFRMKPYICIWVSFHQSTTCRSAESICFYIYIYSIDI